MGAHKTYWSRLGQKRVNRRRFLIGAGMATVGSAATLAGCGGDSPAPAPAAREAPTTTEAPRPTPTETPQPMPTPTPTPTPTPDPYAHRRGGTLRLWKIEDGSLDPGIFRVNNRDVISSTLTQPMTYQPSKNLFAMDGMVGYEQVDPVTLVWGIRPEMRFHNGDPVDSEAVAFSFGRLSKLYQVGDYVTHVRSDGYSFVDSFEPTDDLTLTEHWSRPNADALVHRSLHSYSFLNPRVVQEQGTLEGTYTALDGTTEEVYSAQDLPFGSGSGPYVLTKRDETGTRVERWPDYHRHIPADDGFVEDGPYIDAWESRTFPEYGWKDAFLAGDLDVYGWGFSDEVAEFEGLDHVNVVETQNGGSSNFFMNGLKFHDKRARQALQKAIDYEGFIEAIWPQGGQYTGPISNLLPHWQRLSQQDLQQWQRHDPEEARALWAAADFEVPVDSIKILASGWVWEISELVARSLGEALGLSTQLESTDWYCAPWTSTGCGFRGGEPDDLELVAVGTGEAGGTTGIPHYSWLRLYDPRWHGRTFYHSHLIESPPPDIETDSLLLTGMLEAQEQETDFDTRVGLLTDVQRWILDSAWCVLQLPVSAVQYYGVSARLRDFSPDDWLNGYDLRRESMWLADGQL